ncbi:MAG: thioredoxin [Candidatus Omnitrophota bacterium]
MLEITDKTFRKEVIESSTPVLVDFWATWCMPCKMMEPVLTALSKEYKGKIKFCKLNIDDNTDTPTQFGIHSIPTVLLFKDGEIVETIVGVTAKEAVVEKLEGVLAA